MEKLFYTLTVILAVISFSCEESFSPKEDFKEQYVLWGEVSTLSSVEFTWIHVILSKTYDIEGFNLDRSKTDLYVGNANVVVSIAGKEYKLDVDTTIIGGNPDSIDIGYTALIRMSAANKLIKITATLPDGTILTSSTATPQVSDHEFSYNFPKGFTTNIDESKGINSLQITWRSFAENLFFPRLIITYSKKLGEEIVVDRDIKEIPIKYIKNNDKYEPVYPGYMWEPKVEYPFDVIDLAMAQISDGDPDGYYIIHSISLRNTIFDENLSKYFSSTKGFLDENSIRLDESTYTNINGGIGVFGSMTNSVYFFGLNQSYIESFGYHTQ